MGYLGLENPMVSDEISSLNVQGDVTIQWFLLYGEKTVPGDSGRPESWKWLKNGFPKWKVPFEIVAFLCL